MNKITTYTEIDTKGMDLVIRITDNYLFASIKQGVTKAYIQDIACTGSKQWKAWARDMLEKVELFGLKTYGGENVTMNERMLTKHV